MTEEEKPEIKDLETKLSHNGWWNRIVLPNGDLSVVYVGEIHGLHFESPERESIKGGASLVRYDRLKRERKKRKLILRIPPKIEIEKVPFNEDKLVWTIRTNDSGKYLLRNGKIADGYDQPSGYRNSLNNEASEAGLTLSRELLEMVFGTLDEEVMRMYEQAKRLDPRAGERK